MSCAQIRVSVANITSRQLPFTGSLPPHLTALSYVTFTLVLQTLRVFNASFPPAYASAAIKWAKERVEEFDASLERQLSSVERNSELWNECLGIVLQHAAVLGEVGVDFRALILTDLDAVGAAAVNGRVNGVAAPATNRVADVRKGLGGPRQM